MKNNEIEPIPIELMEPQEQQQPKEEFDPAAVYLYNLSNNPDPEYADEGASGMDIRAYLKEVNPKFLFNAEISEDTVIIHPNGRALIPTGLHTAIPLGLEFQIRPRSGLALKNGITVLNTPGTIDSSYRGDIGVILKNFGEEDFIVHNGDRIAQMVLVPYAKILRFAKVDSIDKLPSSDRMSGGFGHTGLQ